MARSYSQSGNSVRSDLGRADAGSSAFQGATGQAGANFVKAGVGVKESTVVSIANSLNQIADKVVPTAKTTLEDINNKQPTSFNRLMSVKNDNALGNKKVAEAINLLASETDRDKRIVAKDGAAYVQDGLGRGRKAVIELANDIMMRAFVQGQRSFSGLAQTSITNLTKTFGRETAAKLVDLALSEGYDRMQRAGMTYMEKDLRI
jgi:hypothetical protein